ncbi:hypothetical protein [Virgibacillus ihumii]|uniref:hypothetical protein n=1 Tax=Virgibacillus ihumii TaxID=2686091 RepID=UPI00157D4E7A|nr:hypothetical protein [Virgibacillus ihumii]
MKKVLFFIGLSLVMLLTACASDQAKEIVEYHNSYLKNVNHKGKELDKIIKQSLQEANPQAAYQMQKEKAMPIVQEITEYMKSQEPKTDVVKELHQMRLDQFKKWEKGIKMKFEAVKKMGEGISQKKAKELVDKANKQLKEAINLGKKADEKFLGLVEEYNIELETESN